MTYRYHHKAPGRLLSPLSGLVAAVTLGFASTFALAQTPVPEGVADLQKRWEVIQYQTPETSREDAFEALAARAHTYTQQHAGDAAGYTWEGIILSSYANARGGLGALSLAKQAKAAFESAIALDEGVLHGSALSSLGVLYYKVPGWPIGFGDDAKAQTLLEQGLARNPDGIDPNYFYADYLVKNSRAADAMPFLAKAAAAPSRPGREVADEGRRRDIAQLRQRINTP